MNTRPVSHPTPDATSQAKTLASGKAASGGFTLIELLVVIAIISLLAAILFPVFAQAREKARQTSCLSNEKQIGLAVMQYAQDFDETWVAQPANNYPLNGSGVAGADGYNYKDRVLPYTKNEGIWLCPTAQPNGTLDAAAPNTGYHMNGNVVTAGGLPVAAAAAPANLVVLRESGRGVVYDRAILRPSPGACDDVINYVNGGAKFHMPHMRGYNAGFADGHAKWYKPSQTLRLSQFPEDEAESALLAKNAPRPFCTVRPTGGD